MSGLLRMEPQRNLVLLLWPQIRYLPCRCPMSELFVKALFRSSEEKQPSSRGSTHLIWRYVSKLGQRSYVCRCVNLAEVISNHLCKRLQLGLNNTQKMHWFKKK